MSISLSSLLSRLRAIYTVYALIYSVSRDQMFLDKSETSGFVEDFKLPLKISVSVSVKTQSKICAKARFIVISLWLVLSTSSFKNLANAYYQFHSTDIKHFEYKILERRRKLGRGQSRVG